MTEAELREKVAKYKETLAQERAIKKQLVNKLDAVLKVVRSHRERQENRTASKPGGIPFMPGLGDLAKAVAVPFMNTDNPEDRNRSAEAVLEEIRKILN